MGVLVGLVVKMISAWRDHCEQLRLLASVKKVERHHTPEEAQRSLSADSVVQNSRS